MRAYKDSLYETVWGLLETGCAYWAVGVEGGCDRPEAHGPERWSRCEGCWTTVALREGDVDDTHRIDGAAIRRGVEAVAAEALGRYPYNGVPIARAWLASLEAGEPVNHPSNEGPDWEVDAEEGDDDWADWVVQHGLFGELVFG